MITCPICNGTGEAVRHNGVDPQKGTQLHTCWMCHGEKQVIERPTEKMIIKKYWNAEELIEKVLNDNIGAWQTLANE